MDPKQYNLELFRTYREKIVHEDSLVNQRIFWLVTFQALLFTSFALLMQSSHSLQIIRWITVSFAISGIGSALFTWLSVSAAFTVVDSTAERWDTARKTHGIADDEFPGLVGDGINNTPKGNLNFLGKSLAGALPLISSITWIMILIGILTTDFAPAAN